MNRRRQPRSDVQGWSAAYASELRDVPRTVLTWKPSDKEWSLAEVIAHLADCEEMYLNERLGPAATQDRPAFAGVDPAQLAADRRYNEQDPQANLARFAAANAALVALAWSLPAAGWNPA